MGRRGPKPRSVSSFEWTADIAYTVGLIATDGNLSIDGRHIVFVSKDIDQLETFKSILGLQHIKIGKSLGGQEHKTECFRVQFGDVSFYQWLVGIGLTPNKSKTIGPLTVPDEYFFDFLRGCFDGDGSIYAYWDSRWHSSYMFYINFVSASIPFVEWLQGTTLRLCGVWGRITKGAQVFQLRYAKKETRIVAHKMYYSDTLPLLKRKFVKAKKIFTIDNRVSVRNARVV